MRLTQRVRSTIAYLILVVAIAGAFGWQAQATAERRHDNCISRRRLYDGQVLIVNLGADLFKSSPAERQDALRQLYAKIHERPVC